MILSMLRYLISGDEVKIDLISSWWLKIWIIMKSVGYSIEAGLDRDMIWKDWDEMEWSSVYINDVWLSMFLYSWKLMIYRSYSVLIESVCLYWYGMDILLIAWLDIVHVWESMKTLSFGNYIISILYTLGGIINIATSVKSKGSIYVALESGFSKESPLAMERTYFISMCLSS